MFISELQGVALMSDEYALTPTVQESVVSRSSNSSTVAFDREGS